MSGQIFGLEPVPIARRSESKPEQDAAPGSVPDGLTEAQRAALATMSAPIPGEWLDPDKPPPPRPQLLTTSAGDPVLPAGIVSLLLAAGGVGKSMLLTQLAVCVASGRPWLQIFRPVRPGRVLLLFGEEDAPEVHRRLAAAAASLNLEQVEREEARCRIHAVGLAGVDVALLAAPARFESPTETAWCRAMVAAAQEVAGIDPSGLALVAFDPVSRAAGIIDENANPIMTRLVQVFEGFTKLPGNPTVIAAAHTPKSERQPNAPPRTPRGASALFDGARSVLALASAKDGSVTLSFEKANYTRAHEPIRLLRGAGGVLHYDGLADTRQPAAVRHEERILAWLSDHPGWHSKTAISEGLTPSINRAIAGSCLESLVTAKKIAIGPTGRYSIKADVSNGVEEW